MLRNTVERIAPFQMYNGLNERRPETHFLPRPERSGDPVAPLRRIGSVEDLLAAVVEASRCMVVHHDLTQGLQAALEVLGTRTGFDRTCVFAISADGRDLTLHHEWAAAGVKAASEVTGTRSYPVHDDLEVLQPLRSNQVYQSIREERSGANLESNDDVGSHSDLMVPIFVDDAFWGCVCFDSCREARRYTEPEVEALRGAAAAIAAAVQRDRLQRLLQGVNAILGELLGTASLGHRRILARMVDMDEPLRSAQQSLGVEWSLVSPVIVGGACIALLGFDYATPFGEYEEADLAALQTVASTIADAMQRQQLEQRNLAAERERTAEAQTLNHLLEGTLKATRALPGVIGSIPVSFDKLWIIDPRAAEPMVDRMTGGELIAFHTSDTVGVMRDFLESQGNASVMAVPIFIAGVQWGAISFDHAQRTDPTPAQVVVLQTAADTLAAVLGRQHAAQASAQYQEQEVQSGRQRTAEAEALNHLLEGLLQASRTLQEGDDLSLRLPSWLENLADAVQADRASLVDLQANGLAGGDFARSTVEWRRHGPVGQTHTVPRTLDFGLWAVRLYQGGTVWAHIDELKDPLSVRFWQDIHCATALLMPVRVGGQVQYVLCLDWRERKEWQPAFGTVLSTAAEGLAAALRRHAALQEALAEREARIAAEQQRSAGLTLANQALLRATQSLTDGSPLVDFLAAVMLECTAISGARSAGVFLYDESSKVLCLSASVCDGVKVDIHTDPRMAQWRSPVASHIVDRWIPELRDCEFQSFDNRLPPEQHHWTVSREWHAAFGHTHLINIPLLAGGQLVGMLGQCFCGEEAAARFDFAQTRALGHLAALAIRQQQLADVAQKALVASEREKAERERLFELTAANEALRESLDALAESTDEQLFLRHCLQAVAERSGAAAVWLFRASTDDALMRLVGSTRNGRFSDCGEVGDPAHFRQGFIPSPVTSQRLMSSGRLVWRRTVDVAAALDYHPATLSWHLKQGHAAHALHALTVGERMIGLIGMVFDHATPPTARQLEQVHALCQTLSLALELMRQGKIAQRSAENAAVLSERNRLAREIHDGIAQSFLGIQMQLDAMGVPGAPLPAPAQQAMELARHGLNEARRAVAALRPYDLSGRDLPGGLQRLLLQRLSGSTMQPELELPEDWQPLPPDVEDHLYRMVQEAINNVIKHAGAKQVRLELSQASGETTLLLTDDGVGFDPLQLKASPSYGLEGMQQRALRIGARVDVVSKPDCGTQILVSWIAPDSASATAGTADVRG